jgi:hypothetical protein
MYNCSVFLVKLIWCKVHILLTVVMLLLGISIAVWLGAVNSEGISQINYRVHFKSVKALPYNEGFWEHTFYFELPKPFSKFTSCTNNSSEKEETVNICNTFSELLDSLEKMALSSNFKLNIT